MLEEIKKKTMEVLGTTNPEDVAYITQELIDQTYEDEDDFIEEESDSKEVTKVTVHGHNMSYDGNNYRYQRGENPATLSNACGHVKSKKIPFSKWDHVALSNKCTHGSTNHSHITRFVKK